MMEDWNVCENLEHWEKYIDDNIKQTCSQGLLNLTNFFQKQFELSGAPVLFINSKGDVVQRKFATILDITRDPNGGTFSSFKNQLGLKTKSDIEKSKYFSELDGCIPNNLPKFISVYTSMSLYEKDEFLGFYITKLIENIDGATHQGRTIEVLINKVSSSFSKYFLGGGSYGEQGYWKLASDILMTYKSSQTSWYILDSQESCYTCNDLLYNQTINNVRLVDWLQEGVNNMLLNNTKIPAKICNGQETPGLSCI